MKSTDFPPFHTRVIRRLLQLIFRFLFRLMAKVTVTGKSNIPDRPPYLVVFNHVSIYGPPFLVAFWPFPPEVLGAIDVWSRAGQNILARLYRGIPIQRGEIDRGAMEQMVKVLKSGRPLLVSPEGGRSHSPGMRQAKSGILYIIKKTQVPIVPVGVIGTTDDFFQQAIHGQRPCLEMNIGEPFYLPDDEDMEGSPKDIRQARVDLIMKKIASLLPKEYQGFYENPPGRD